MKRITNPAEALKLVGTENSQLHEELAALYAEVDLYRDALMTIAGFDPKAEDAGTKAKTMALAALAQKRTEVPCQTLKTTPLLGRILKN